MREFFRPWRRRIGMMTLVMACIAMVGWVRSFSIHDVITCRISSTCRHFLVSNYGGVAWNRLDESKPLLETDHPFHHAEVAKENAIHQTFEHGGVIWNWRWREFEFGQVNLSFAVWSPVADTVTAKMTIWQIPYWSFVLPMTALSAFLLIKKPKYSNQKKIGEPIPETVVNHA